MMIMAEIFQGTALLLDESGRVWEVRVGDDDQPQMQMLAHVTDETIRGLLGPQLALYVPHL